jgi:hypothetical protein
MDTKIFADYFMSIPNAISLEMEKRYDGHAIFNATQNKVYIPIIAVVLYLLFCYYGQIVMADRKPFNLRIPLAIWNAFLCIFSFIGMCKTVSFCVFFF